MGSAGRFAKAGGLLFFMPFLSRLELLLLPTQKMVLTFLDLLLTPLYLAIIYFFAKAKQARKIGTQPEYKYYTKGLMYKLFGGIGVCLVYQLYYTGGDTSNYYVTTGAYFNLIFEDFDTFIDVVINGNLNDENYSLFNETTGLPVYWRDTTAGLVSRIIMPLYLLGGCSFIPTTVLLALVCYGGVWRLYMLFVSYFPKIQRELAIAILFIPSVVFWGSGLLKDTITLSAVGGFTYYFYLVLIRKKIRLTNIIRLALSLILILAIKPYIFFALLPGALIWYLNEMVSGISSKTLRRLVAPFLIVSGFVLGVFILSQLGDYLGHYSVDTVLERALVVNLDQQAAYYGGNSFDIGKFEPTIPGVLSKAHLAVSAALFRPYIWDARNPVMIMSAIENAYILILTFLLLIRLRLKGFFLLIGENPLLLYSGLFSLFFAFSVGLATSNFGTLVRLKIPCIPFYVAMLFILQHIYKERKEEKKMRSSGYYKVRAKKVLKPALG